MPPKKKTPVSLIPSTGKLSTEVPDFVESVRAFLIANADSSGGSKLHIETIAVLEKRIVRDILVD